MKLGLIGLGKMGLNLAENMMDHENEVVGFDLNKDFVDQAVTAGAEGADSLADMVAKLPSPKVVWVMVPAGKPTESTIDQLLDLLDEGDFIIDGGNSFWKDSVADAQKAEEKGIKFFDCGTSGGQSGARHDGNFMIGGNDAAAFKTLEPLYEGIAQKDGYLYTGKAGSGHYLKMVHNGIEYGMMEAIGEGFDVLEHSAFDYDNESVARLWNSGSVVRSWLMELAQDAFANDAKLDNIKGTMHSSGEGKWTLEEAMNQQVATPVIAMSLLMRYRSMENDTFTGKVVSSLRNGFGGHAVDKA
ncbi:MAG: decarboxylating 6-phosphogluconate dehydrogenase [Furfurilactobacillus sp.]|jgi:6-phosphogluconate dehydrogenase|uniref:Decarboxylating 6-phosphogluconate dehydrogenase n=1 Tax=Furfurilactobacillus milii TaxID=2888272 RepID=A0ABT6D6H7_9LACO|nr:MULTISPECIES: decarboxylating 6-phosphogluconate dehydrogenase [Furfurilactobacillus]QLE66275.1 6-phosphogluconate dehydrogenase decarboxylating [Furfurilactobacillus rossiae]MCF6159733.1 decarboxylating 6-phosphogluconate dehydrogenase [Furfurilactobacillus milii]MCF6163182.1 decarboxylating 6-phosphogluconate dehydrogenase [Furfurilactobacillus milii]MCF6419113.1 decarboxylating 6-phosphogluconate dehydrogenase [Furfurilactobacillus milii]MCH4011012.1 decarboxylating 6-phosphogluconate de